MSKTKKIWIGFFTFLPILGFIGYFIFFFSTFLNMAELGNGPGNESEYYNSFLGGFGFAIASMIIAVVSGIGILIYDIVHVVNNKKFTENNRLMWILILVLANGVGSIIYFFVEILPQKEEDLVID